MMEPNRKKSSFLLYTACAQNNWSLSQKIRILTSLIVWVCSTSTSLGAVSMLSDISVLIAISNWPLKNLNAFTKVILEAYELGLMVLVLYHV